MYSVSDHIAPWKDRFSNPRRIKIFFSVFRKVSNGCADHQDSYSESTGVFYHGATDLVGQGLLIIEDSRSHSDTPYSEGLLWTSDRPVTETST